MPTKHTNHAKINPSHSLLFWRPPRFNFYKFDFKDGVAPNSSLRIINRRERREGARLFIDPVLPGEFFRQMRRDEFTKLMQGAAVVFRRRYVFHTADSLVGIRRRPPFFNPARKGVSPHPVGWLCSRLEHGSRTRSIACSDFRDFRKLRVPGQSLPAGTVHRDLIKPHFRDGGKR